MVVKPVTMKSRTERKYKSKALKRKAEKQPRPKQKMKNHGSTSSDSESENLGTNFSGNEDSASPLNSELRECTKTRKRGTAKNLELKDGMKNELERTRVHREQLAALAEKDPDFFRFLQEQDPDLLQFDESDVDSVEDELGSEIEGVDEGSEVEETKKLAEKKVAVDRDGRKIVTHSLVENLQSALFESSQVSPSAVRTAVDVFMACVARVGANVDPPDYVISDQHVFEKAVRLCFQNLGKCLYTMLGPTETKGMKEELERKRKMGPQKAQTAGITAVCFRKWKKHSSVVKNYLHALLLFLNELQTPEVVVCTLRALNELVDLLIHFSKLIKNFVKALVRIWSRKTDECRCAAFITLCKAVRVKKEIFPTVLKSCYLGYVTNVREVTPETWPLITFMQKSYAELCMIYPEISYQYAFTYIRQMAIHLRNAMIAKRKDLIQTVYNWQFLQCLYLWTRVISKAHRAGACNEEFAGIAELAYPLCQIIIATMKLYSSTKYFPLRLHCIRILLQLQVHCRIYVPTLSLAVSLLDEVAQMIKKKPTRGKGTTKGVEMNCILKASTSQLDEAGYRHAAVEALFRLHLEAAYILRSSCAFADIVFPLDAQLKAFTKKCRNSEHACLFKSLSSKLNEHAKRARFILAARSVELNDNYCLASLNAVLSASDSPLVQFYDCWQTVWKLQQKAVSQAIAKPSATAKKNEKEDRKDRKKAAEQKKNTEANEKVEAMEKDLNDNGDGDNENEVQKRTKAPRREIQGKTETNADDSSKEFRDEEDELRDLVVSDSECSGDER